MGSNKKLAEDGAEGFQSVTRTIVQPDRSTSILAFEFKDTIEFHEDEDEGMPWTALRREYRLTHDDKIIVEWWEEYAGSYGGGYTGWWIEELDASGPPDGLKEFLSYMEIQWPEISVPQPPDEEDTEDDDEAV